MVEKVAQNTLRFNGSVWCNLDIALRNVDQIVRKVVRPLGLTVIEWYILRALYERDGQQASELARAVGRAATSFTPNLDKLQQKKGLIERRADTDDRRAVRIYLTPTAEKMRPAVLDSAQKVDKKIQQSFDPKEYEMFLAVLAGLQSLNGE